MPNTFTIPSADPWEELETYGIGVEFGSVGSAMRKFIVENYNQWNVKNWVEYAAKEFSKKHINEPFDFGYTPKDDFGEIRYVRSTFNRLRNSTESGFIGVTKGTTRDIGSVYSVMEFRMPQKTKFHEIFGKSGNEFFFGGEFVADKVDGGEWYDIKKLELTSLNFMDKLGRKCQILPKV